MQVVNPTIVKSLFLQPQADRPKVCTEKKSADSADEEVVFGEEEISQKVFCMKILPWPFQ